MKPTLDEALDALEKPGEVRAPTEAGGEARVDVVRAGPIGVRVRKVEVHRAAEVDLREECAALPDRLRALGEEVVPVEVEPRLGGGVLRSTPGQQKDAEFYQVDVTPAGTAVTRHRAKQGGREAVEFDLTRDQLGRLLDELEG